MIRKCRQEDIDHVAKIADAAWSDIYAMFKERYGEELFNIYYPDSDKTKSEQVRELFHLHSDRILVCEREGRIVGFVTFSLDREKKLGTICNNAADPSCGQKGVGQEMYAAVLSYFKEQGMQYATVVTGLHDVYARARRAYERAGFNMRREDARYFMKL